MLILDPTKMLQGLVVCQACLVARVYFKQYFLEGVLILRAESYSVTRVQMKVFDWQITWHVIMSKLWW